MQRGHVAKLVYAHDSKSCGLTTVRVRLPPRPPLVRGTRDSNQRMDDREWRIETILSSTFYILSSDTL